MIAQNRGGNWPGRRASRRLLGPWLALRIGLVSTFLSVLSGPAGVAQQLGDYVLGPSDVLAITVWDQLDLSGKFTIEDARRTLERKTVIEDALLDAQATSMKLDFLLVHAPRSESPDARQLVEGAGIHVLGPVEVLSFAKNHFQGRRR